MRRRRSFEPGHRPKFLVVVDNTPESGSAWRFAARRAARIGAGIIMLATMPAPDAQEWLNIEEMMRAEALEKAEGALAAASSAIRDLAGIEPELVARLGKPADEIVALVEQDEDISFLVLAAGAGTDGPGPLVTALAGKQILKLPVPVVIVPGSLSEADIDALA